LKAEIISIGTELTSGQRLDTNSQWLSTQLGEVGIPVHFHTTVGDDLDENVAVFRTAVERADLVLITGGLGPTQDDLTREALARTAGVELELDESSLEHIQKLFARRGREMPERNRVQALFPAGSRPLANPDGTAPGIHMTIPRAARDGHACVVAMPGVPSEMKIMFRREVLPLILPGSGAGRVMLHRRIHCFGLGESAVEEKLLEVTRRGRQPLVGITVHEATITLRITAQGPSEAACREQIEPTAAIVYERLGNHVFGEEDDELEHAIGRLLLRTGRTLATAESGTGGLVAHRLTDVLGIGEHYLGGVIAPSDHAKEHLLAISPLVIESAGRISREVAAAMAVGVRQRFFADLGLGVTEWAGPRDAEAEEQPRVFIALSTDDRLMVREHNLGGDPAIIKSRSAKLAMNLVRLHLLGCDGA
jgi:nicotinamide-nucleotide amidase